VNGDGVYARCELCDAVLTTETAHTTEAFGVVSDWCEAHCPRCFYIDVTGRAPEEEDTYDR
jgi:phage FluMu protein Com